MEQMIIFVYDTSFCQTEEDDPQKAVVFFHPKWVSDQQRLALCGQLMGAAHFCSSLFSTPKVLTLQSGKFVLKKFDQFIMSVGSDQTLPDWVLTERFNILQSLLEFYHKSFNAILTSVGSEYDLFIKRLYEVFEVYNPIIQYIVSTFGNAPTIKFPRKKNTMFLEAFQLLQSCCSFEGVLGGTVLYNSRVVASVLDSDITKMLALTDPFRMRSEAEQIKTPFHLPIGVQLIRVYLKHSAYESARRSGTTTSSYYTGSTAKQKNAANDSEGKHDITKIFTVLEESDNNSTFDFTEKAHEMQVREVRRQKKRKHSRAKIENTLKERSKSFIANHNIKICSTPTVEKKIVHEDFVSICNNPKLDAKKLDLSLQYSNPVLPDPVHSSMKSTHNAQLSEIRYTNNNLYRMSMDDLMIDFSYKNYPVPLRYYSFGLPKICKEVEQTIKEEHTRRKLYRSKFYKTIADPSNPVFRFDGFPVSKSLYNRCLDEHYKDFITANITIDSREEFIRRKNLEIQACKNKIENNTKPDADEGKKITTTEKLCCPIDKNDKINNNPLAREKEINSINQKLFRRSLTLSLKPVTYGGSDNGVPMSVVKNKVLNARTPTTPLMTKLSLLTLEEQSDVKGFSVTNQKSENKKTKDSSIVKKGYAAVENKNVDVANCGLYVYGQHNLTVLLLLDENTEQNPELILSLWEICTANLEKVEILRNKSCDNISNEGANNSYSFLSMDPKWDVLQKSGTWGNEDMRVVGALHQDLIQTQNLTEIIVRNEDAVIYGYRCGSTETFYQQGGCSALGLPTPADLMGVVPLKARRRLERDHGIILL